MLDLNGYLRGLRITVGDRRRAGRVNDSRRTRQVSPLLNRALQTDASVDRALGKYLAAQGLRF